MKEHWDFLKESDTSLGQFYPLHYTMAVFENMKLAEAASEHFVSSGFDEDDVAAVPGSFVVNRLESEQGANWFDKLREEFVRVVGTEERFLDNDVKLAQHGGAFVFVYTPSQELVERARTVIERVQPICARRYHRIGIEQILSPSKPSTL